MSKSLLISDIRHAVGSFIYIIVRLVAPRGVSQKVVVSRCDLESKKATQDVLANKAEVDGIRQGLAELEAGQGLSFEEVFGEPLHGAESQAGRPLPRRV